MEGLHTQQLGWTLPLLCAGACACSGEEQADLALSIGQHIQLPASSIRSVSTANTGMLLKGSLNPAFVCCRCKL